MSFIPITTSEITTGEPVSSSTQTKIKDNFDSLNDRVLTVEGGSSTVYPPIIFRVNGAYSGRTIGSMIKTMPNFNLTVTGVRLLIDSCGTSGTTEVSLKWKRGAGAWTSVCSTNPSVIYSAGNDVLSSNAILNSGNVDIQAGDLVRVDVVSTQVGGHGFLVRIDYNKI